MSRFSSAVQAFVRAWRGTPAAPPAVEPARPAAARSDAIALLATLQQEARFVDFLMEPLSGYSDEQVGAAARDVHQKCRAAVLALFAIEPLLRANEGAAVTVPSGYDPVQYRLIGSLAGQGPFKGTVQHPGWKALRCELPLWTGRAESATVIAPAEVDLGAGTPGGVRR